MDMRRRSSGLAYGARVCLVAEGAADFYSRAGPTMEWDTAAAQAVVEAAGGAATTLDGRPLGYNKASLLKPAGGNRW